MRKPTRRILSVASDQSTGRIHQEAPRNPPAAKPYRLSAIIITRNESAHIGECLDSLIFTDEVVVVDCGSTDDTCTIARAWGARVLVTDDWPGFGPQKNRALDMATGDWVLSIDADERVTPELARAICQELGRPAADGYRIARLSNFCGRWIRHGGWWPDRVLRLFRRGAARFTDVAVHEGIHCEGRVATLAGHFLHYPYPDLDTVLAKTNRYSSDAAAAMHAAGKTANLASAVGHGAWTFLRIYVFRKGFLDGREGFLLAATAAAGSFFRYGKLMLLGRRK